MHSRRSTLADQVLLDWSLRYGRGEPPPPEPYSLRMTVADFAADVLRLESPGQDEIGQIVRLYATLVDWPDGDREQAVTPVSLDGEAWEPC